MRLNQPRLACCSWLQYGRAAPTHSGTNVLTGCQREQRWPAQSVARLHPDPSSLWEPSAPKLSLQVRTYPVQLLLLQQPPEHTGGDRGASLLVSVGAVQALGEAACCSSSPCSASACS